MRIDLWDNRASQIYRKIGTLPLPMEDVDRTKYQIDTMNKPIQCKAIYSSITISQSEFKGIVNSSNIFFRDLVEFEKTSFSCEADFSGASFNGKSFFKETKFDDYANFEGASFRNEAEFSEAKFSGFADFWGVKFSDYANFNYATFIGYANFFKALFNGYSNFDHAMFSCFADFRGASFIGNADFRSATFNEDAMFTEAIFEKGLDWEFTKYKRLFIRWESISKPRHKCKLLENWNKSCNIQPYNETTYLLLIDNLKNIGFFDDSDNCYYDYRIRRRRTLINPIYRFFDWLLLLFYGYGVRPLRPLIGLIFLILLFGLLYPYIGFAGHSTLDQFNTSLIVSLSGTRLIDNPIPSPTPMLYWAFSIEKLLTALLFGFFLVSIGKTIIR
jgi:uncharacterized protein YjbI with pentapeptide repeats